MMFAKDVAKVMIVIFAICFAKSDGKPIEKRAVTEIELMHHLAAYKTAKERMQWLLQKVQEAQNFVSRKNGGAENPLKREDNGLFEKYQKRFGADMDVLTKETQVKTPIRALLQTA